MQTIIAERDSIAWMNAQVRKLTESDADTLIGTPGGIAWQTLVEEIFLDFAAVPRDPTKIAERLSWRIRNAETVTDALNWFAKLRVGQTLVRRPGLLGHDEQTWLACSPHGITDDSVVHVTARVRASAWERAAAEPVSTKINARAQVMMYVTGRPFCDVLDYWSSGHAKYDRARRCRLEFDQAFIDERFLPACSWFWADVRRLHDEAFDSTRHN